MSLNTHDYYVHAYVEQTCITDITVKSYNKRLARLGQSPTYFRHSVRLSVKIFLKVGLGFECQNRRRKKGGLEGSWTRSKYVVVNNDLRITIVVEGGRLKPKGTVLRVRIWS